MFDQGFEKYEKRVSWETCKRYFTEAAKADGCLKIPLAKYKLNEEFKVKHNFAT
jgi:hypothetical protein